MDEWLVGLERLGAVQALKASFYAYPIVNAVHIAAIGALLTGVALLDLRLLGAWPNLPEAPLMRLLRTVALLAFTAAAVTGLTLFAVRASDYAAAPLFLIKMLLIGLAGLNFLAFATLDRHRSAETPLTSGRKLLVVMSLLVWPTVLLAGRFLGFR